jgi:2-hydroxychromene-2-carboxylate isomerase
MTKTVEFVFDVGSPTTYLAWTQLPKIAKRNDAAVTYTPVLLGGIFKATGNSSPVTVPAIWVDGKDMGAPEVIREVLAEGGLDADHVLGRVQEDAVKQALIANTEDAVARGVFGAPTFFVGERMFFGQDRLAFVEDALSD